jgi:hypothetical protein
MNNKVCPNCKVELEAGMDTCPLCDESETRKPKTISRAKYASELLQLSERKSMVYAWELSAIIAFSAILILFIVDLVVERGIYWSLFAITAIGGIFLMLTSFIFLLRRPIWLAITVIASLLSALFLFDLIRAPLNWFFALGLPIGLSFGLVFSLLLFLLNRLKFRGFNVLGFILIFISGLCFPIEVFADLYMHNEVDIEWSAIAAASMLPISWVLLFLHYRLKKGNDLRSFFHV